MGPGSWLRWSYSHQEGWGWIQEDQGVLGLHPCGGGAGQNQLTKLSVLIKYCEGSNVCIWYKILILKSAEQKQKLCCYWHRVVLKPSPMGPVWNYKKLNSYYVIYVQEKSSGRTAHYKLTSTVMLWLQTTKTDSGTMNLGGSLTRQVCWYRNHESSMKPQLCSSHPSTHLASSFTDGKGWNSWRILTPHRQHWPPCRSVYNSYCHVSFLGWYFMMIKQPWDAVTCITSCSAVLQTSVCFFRIWRTRFAPHWMKSTLGRLRILSMA